MTTLKKKILAISSGGGHWVQLLRLRPAFEGCLVTYVTVDKSYYSQVEGEDYRVIVDATRWNKFKLLLMLFQILKIILIVRPNVVISTGAAPGYFAIRLGRLLGARGVWLDSIANVEVMSKAGQMVKPYAHLWLTQWEHLASEDGPEYKGSVL